MEFYLAVLLVSSLACVGLLALWASTSRRHWFVRTAVFMGVLSLLLLIPAQEPFAIFLCQGLVVTIGVQSHRYWRKRTSSTNWTWRFSLTNVLLFTTIVAVAVPIAMVLLAEEWLDWHFVWQLGVASGIIALLAHWCLLSKIYSRWKKASIGLACLLALSAALSEIEPGAASWIFYNWNQSDLSGNGWFNSGTWQAHFWFSVCGLVFLAILFLDALANGQRKMGCVHKGGVWLNFSTEKTFISDLLLRRKFVPDPFELRVMVIFREQLRKMLLFSLLFLLGAPSIYFYYRLMAPLLPIPQDVLPSPNGYDDLVAAGKMADCRLINFWGETPIKQLVAGLPQYANVYERAELGFSRTVRVPIQYGTSDVDVDSYGALRSLCRAYGARGDVHLDAGDIEKAMEDYLTISRLSSQSRNGGILIHWLVATAIDGVGESSLYQMHKRMNASQCLRAIETYAKIKSSTDSLEEILYRDRVWYERASGFYGRLCKILEDLAEEDSWMNSQIEEDLAPRCRAKHQLLIVALAIRAFEDVHGTLPANLAQLVPEFLEQLPQDPFDETGGPLRFQAHGDEYQLYSIGQNRVDDGGSKPEQDTEYLSGHETGDLLLDVVYAKWEAQEGEEESDPIDAKR